MSEQPEQKEPWQMTRAEYARQRKLRAAARETVAEEKAGRRQAARDMGFPQGHAYGLVEKLADLSPLKQSHRQAVKEALSHGLPVPPDVLADYPDLVRKAARSKGRILDADQACHAQADLLRLRRFLIESLWDDVREGCRRGQWSDETRQLAGQAAVLEAALRKDREKSAGTLSRESLTSGRKT